MRGSGVPDLVVIVLVGIPIAVFLLAVSALQGREDLGFALAFAALLLALGGLVLVAAPVATRRWLALGTSLGLAPEVPPTLWRPRPPLAGRLGGRRSRVRLFKEGKRPWLETSVEAPRVRRDLRLEVRRQTFADRVAVALGGSDVEVGDASFDALHRVRTSDPDAARRALDAATRHRIATLPGGGVVRLDDGVLLHQVETTAFGRVGPERLRETLAALDRVAEAIERAAPRAADAPGAAGDVDLGR